MLSSVLLSLRRSTIFVSMLLVLIADQISLGRMMTATAAAAAECPSNYWDKPSKRCAEPLVNALESAVRTKSSSRDSPTILPSDEHRNGICSTWEMTNECYKQLSSSCVNDSSAISTLNAHRHRFSVYSKPCSDRSQRNQQLSDCFLVLFIPTQTCTEAFDMHFRMFVANQHYSQACRIVSSVLKCFVDLSNKIAEGHCGADGAVEYNSSYIKPVVDQSRETVMSKCTLDPPYDKIYVQSSSLSTRLVARGNHVTGFVDGQSVTMFIWFLFLPLCVALVARQPQMYDLVQTL